MTSPTPYPPGQQGGLPPGLTPGGSLPAGQHAGSGWIPVGAGSPPAPPVVPVGAGGGRRRGRPALTALGIVLIVAGIGGAAALFVAGSQRYSDGIEQLARGPANCVTTLDVAKDATYYFYVENKGEVDDVRGNCPSLGESFDVDGDGDARLSLSDDNGDAVRLRRADGTTYDSGGYHGELVRSARLDEGRYQLAVEADDDVVVAVGRDVEDLKTNLLLPIIVGLAGLALGLAVVLLGRRGGSAAPARGPASSASPSPSAAAPAPPTAFGGSGLGAGYPAPGAPHPTPGAPDAPPGTWGGFEPPQPGQR